MTEVAMQVVNDSIVIKAIVNSTPIEFVLDTGDAIGPVFTAADAAKLELVQGAPFGVEGAGGDSTSYETTADIRFDDRDYSDEPSAIDISLEGQSLLGFPFFYAKCLELKFNFADNILTMVG
jgi:hypothetical protein